MNLRTRSILTISFLIFAYNTWGQDSVNNNGQRFGIRDIPTITKETKPPLYVIKSQNGILQLPTDRRLKKILKHFKLEWIDSVEVLRDKSATEKYGSLGQQGVVIIHLKEAVYHMLPRRLKKYKTSE